MTLIKVLRDRCEKELHIMEYEVPLTQSNFKDLNENLHETNVYVDDNNRLHEITSYYRGYDIRGGL